MEELLILISAIDLAITSNTCCKYKCGICSQTTYRCWLIGLSDLNILLCQCLGQKVIWGISVWAIQDIYCCVEDKMCDFESFWNIFGCQWWNVEYNDKIWWELKCSPQTLVPAGRWLFAHAKKASDTAETAGMNGSENHRLERKIVALTL